jgi:hypothetical protein
MKRRFLFTTVQGISQEVCCGCGAAATVSLRPLGADDHRFYCHACAKALRTQAAAAARPRTSAGTAS